MARAVRGKHARRRGPFPAGTVANPRVGELDTTGRRLRFDIETSTGGNVGAVEIRVYGPAR